MSKEETPITAEEFLKSDKSIDFKIIAEQGLTKKEWEAVKGWMEEYAQAKVEELQKENEHLKQVYEHRCNEVKDKVETIHNYFNQITKLQKGIDKAYEALNDIVWLIERGASMDEVIESVNAKARPFLLTNKKEV